jgi:organic hydroperoxide reductase OsmC/OhrA
MQFTVTAQANAPIEQSWTCTGNEPNLPPISCSIPPEFKGPGGAYSPEDLFALSILNCEIATFKVFCSRMQVTFNKISGKAIVSVGKNAQGVLAITKLDITMRLEGASDAEKAKKLLEEAKKHCLIANAVKTEMNFNYELA